MYRNDWYTPGRGRRIPVRRVLQNDKDLFNQHQHPLHQPATTNGESQSNNRKSIPMDDSKTKTGHSFNEPVASDVNIASSVAQPGMHGANVDGTAQISDTNEAPSTASPNWQAMALQMQADMENYRQRQVRLAAEAIEQERHKLLKQFLPVADNLQRALQYEAQSDITLRKGVALVLRQMMQTLENEGVSTINTTNTHFDPNLHEAVAMAPANVESGAIIDEIEAGYTVNEKLLRPAKVVVAR